MLGRPRRGDGADMARIVTGTSSFVNPNERPVRTYGVASRQRDWGPGLGGPGPRGAGAGALGASAVAREGSLVDIANLGSQLRRVKHLHVVSPGQDPEPDLDDPAHSRATQQRTVGV